MALILSIETGTDVCSVALSRGNELISLRESGEGRNHASKLGVYIDEILKENDYSPDELDAIAISKGPGSYTGLRIGVSMAKGLCYSLNIPLIGVGSLEAMAHVAAEDYDAGILDIDNWDSALLCPMIDARRMEVYAEVFNSSIKSVSEVVAEIITPESFAAQIAKTDEFVVFGNGAAKTLEILPQERVKFVEVTPSARGLVKIAHKAFLEEKFEDVAYFEPFYLKDFIVIPSKKKIF